MATVASAVAVVVLFAGAAASTAATAEGADAPRTAATQAATLLARPTFVLAPGQDGSGCPPSLRLPSAPSGTGGGSGGGGEGGDGGVVVASDDDGACSGGLTLRAAAAATARLYDTADAATYDGLGGGTWLATAFALTSSGGDGGGGGGAAGADAGAAGVLVGEPRERLQGGAPADPLDACAAHGVVLVLRAAPLSFSASGANGTTRVTVPPGEVAAVALAPTADGGASCVYAAADGDGGGGDDDDAACFPGDAVVWVYPPGGGRDTARAPAAVATAMADLRLGDRVATGGGRASRVVAFSHADPFAVTTMVTVSTAGGGRLTLSPGHLVYTATSVDGGGGNGSGGGGANDTTCGTPCVTGWTLTPAADLTVGTTLRSPTGAPLPVTAVGRTAGVGLYNPHTAAADGDLLVGGVWASTWTTAVGVGVGRALLVPVRWWAAAAGVGGGTGGAWGLGPDGWLRGGGGGVHRWLPHRVLKW